MARRTTISRFALYRDVLRTAPWIALLVFIFVECATHRALADTSMGSSAVLSTFTTAFTYFAMRLVVGWRIRVDRRRRRELQAARSAAIELARVPSRREGGVSVR
ncbi:MAG: hypothetical protein JNJ88_03195 [Planctomycetes bacterium]|nr:hypothetical protein [Planctomycetota bacterium]